MLEWVLGRAAADPGQRSQSCFVGFRQGVQIFLGRSDAAVAEPFPDDLQVGATGDTGSQQCSDDVE